MSTFVCACGTRAHLSTHVEVRGQVKGVSSLLSQDGSWELDVACQAWLQAPLYIKSSQWSYFFRFTTSFR